MASSPRSVQFHLGDFESERTTLPANGAHSELQMAPLERTARSIGIVIDEKQTDSEKIISWPQAEEEEGRVALLLSAASKNNVSKILSLIRAGVSASAVDYDRRSALHLAASEGQLEAVQVLVQEKADLHARDRFGHTALDDAVSNGHAHVSAFLRDHGASHGAMFKLEAALIIAASEGKVSEVKRLLDNGVSVNCADYDLRSALHLAVAESHVEVIQLLLERNANPFAEDRWGLTPLADAHRQAARVGHSAIVDLFQKYLTEKHENYLSPFTIFFLIFEATLIVLIAVLCDYDDLASGGIGRTANGDDVSATDSTGVGAIGSWEPVWKQYPLYQDVHVMIFVGFGFLMVFLRKHGYTSLGMTFLIGAVGIQWYQLTGGFWNAVFHNTWTKVQININSLLNGDFAVAAVLISYGGLLGKVNPLQMLTLTIIEIAIYSLNAQIATQLAISDIGGTMVIHLFGCYFGLAASWVLSPKAASGHTNNSAVYHSDLMAMIGTLFLWMFWPSFNAATAVGATQHRAIINTVLSLCGCCLTAFMCSHIFRREQKWSMVDIQNATLAGGVAIGAMADHVILPGAAAAIGAIAGVLSVLGFVYVQPFLEAKLGLYDTCGIHNLHGMPALLGALGAVISAYMASWDHYGGDQLALIWPDRADAAGANFVEGSRSASKQAAYQFAYICITLAISIASGLFTGAVLRYLPVFDQFPADESKRLFNDSEYWEVPQLEQPYYFDHRGEISRGAGNQAKLDTDGDDHYKKPSAEEIKELNQRIESLESRLFQLQRPQTSKVGNGGSNGTEQTANVSVPADKVAKLFDLIIHKLDSSSASRG